MAKTFSVYREDELKFPNFKSVETARLYFERNYRGQYNYGYCEKIDEGHYCYFDDLNGQPIQISEYDDGTISVHVVY